MDRDKWKDETTLLLPSLGWLLLSEEERQLLQAYVELALSRQFEEGRDKQEWLSRGAAHEHKAEVKTSPQLRESA
jgi:uncharacterized protein HemY